MYPLRAASFIDKGIKTMQKNPPQEKELAAEETAAFDDALRKLLSSPPAPKVTAVKKTVKAKKKAR